MVFMKRKKRYKFSIVLCLEEITDVTFLCGILYAKVRLRNGGRFVRSSDRAEIQEHKALFGCKFKFICTMKANSSTCVLKPCKLRISVRREVKGGLSCQKLGFVDLNLAEFAGLGSTQRKFLLESYNRRFRADNSVVCLNIDATLISGDIFFRLPSMPVMERQDSSSGEPFSEDIAGSSTLNSIMKSPLFKPEVSLSDDVVEAANRTNQMKRDLVNGLGYKRYSGGDGHSKNDKENCCTYGRMSRLRIEATRVSSETVINNILKMNEIKAEEEGKSSQLMLYIGLDGRTTLGSQQTKRRYQGVLKPMSIALGSS